MYTVEQWRLDLERLERQEENPEGHTTAEWSELIGKCESSTRAWIRGGIRFGTMRLAGTRDLVRIDGRHTRVSVYSLIDKQDA